MDWSQVTLKKIRGLIVFTIMILVGLWRFDIVLDILGFVFQILFPFILGASIAFVINVPMSFLEKKLFGEEKEARGKVKKKLARPASLVLTIALVVGIVVLIMFVVIPQLGKTFANLGESIALFIPRMQEWVREFTNNNQEIMDQVNSVEFNSQKVVEWLMSALGSGAGSVMNTTVAAAKSIVSAVASFFIAFSFACYILVQKERLHVQVRKVFFAFVPRRKAEAVLEICSLTYKTFSSFLTGQCVEAVILGSMFLVSMTVLQLSYALLIGMLIAFTALIPVFGGFIGCGVGAFLLFIEEPRQAVIFVILFLVLQQIEGNFIYPHVVGGSVGLPSIWVLAAVSVGGKLMGVIGMLVFIPIASVMYALFREVVYLKLKKNRIKKVTAKSVDEYTDEEVEKMNELFHKEHEND